MMTGPIPNTTIQYSKRRIMEIHKCGACGNTHVLPNWFINKEKKLKIKLCSHCSQYKNLNGFEEVKNKSIVKGIFNNPCGRTLKE